MKPTSVRTPVEERVYLTLNSATGSSTQSEAVEANDLREAAARYRAALPSV